MKFLITSGSSEVQEILQVSKKKKRIRLKYGEGYVQGIKGDIACELQDDDGYLSVNIEGKQYTFDIADADYLRKVLNAWHKHLDSPWVPEEDRKDVIYKLK